MHCIMVMSKDCNIGAARLHARPKTYPTATPPKPPSTRNQWKEVQPRSLERTSKPLLISKVPGIGGEESTRGANVRVRSRVKNVPENAKTIERRSKGKVYASKKGVAFQTNDVTIESEVSGVERYGG